MNFTVKMESPVKKNVRFEPSERTAMRKRNLFPSQHEEDSDSDLGNICPIDVSSSSPSPERYDSSSTSPIQSNRYLMSLNNKNYSYRKVEASALFEHLKHVSSPRKDRGNIPCSPETLRTSNSSSPDKENTEIVIPDTPLKVSPSQGLKTPHDNVNTNKSIPKLVRKSLADMSLTKNSFKRKFESPSDTSNKSLKLDSHSKVSKARTALFTDSIFPAKSFYPKTDENPIKKHYFLADHLQNKKLSKKDSNLFLCNRKKGLKLGQINAGVRHKIRKPKHKSKLTKTQMMKVAMNILDNSPLNDILNNLDLDKNKENSDVNGITIDQIQKMDSILKNISSNYGKPLTSALEVQQIIKQDISGTNTEQSDKPTAKRPLSPQEEPNKKFFKSHRTSGTVTISKNIKLKYDNGEMSLVQKKTRERHTKTSKLSFDVSDLTVPEENLTNENFTEIINRLEEKNSKENTIVLTAHSSVNASENSIQLHNMPKQDLKQVNNMLLSPTTLMCDMTSGLALDSPKSQIIQQIVNLDKASNVKKHISFSDDMANNTEEKLYPVFYPSKKTNEKSEIMQQQSTDVKKVWKPIADNQYLIDAGQKKFGATQCPECNVVYHLGDPDDEMMHFNHHNSISVLRFHGWKNERVVSDIPNGKIIQINPMDPKPWWRKVKDLIQVINNELGYFETELETSHSKVYLYILNKQIAGCVIAEPKLRAHRMLPPIDGLECCSEESYPVKCGISRIWVAQTRRRQGIATSLLNTVRGNFIYGHILSVDEIAFSSPTEVGKKLAAKYTKSDCYLVYIM